VDTQQFWKETGVDVAVFEQWLVKEKTSIRALSARIEPGIVEILATMSDGKTHCKRVIFEGDARPWLGEVEKKSGIKITIQP
jgi:hypothetical protein